MGNPVRRQKSTEEFWVQLRSLLPEDGTLQLFMCQGGQVGNSTLPRQHDTPGRSMAYLNQDTCPSLIDDLIFVCVDGTQEQRGFHRLNVASQKVMSYLERNLQVLPFLLFDLSCPFLLSL